MTEKRLPRDKDLTDDLGLDAWQYPTPLPERPAFEPVPLSKEARRVFWIGTAIVIGVAVGVVAFVVWLKWSSG